MRPLLSDSGKPFEVVTHMLRRHEEPGATLARFTRRAQQVSTRNPDEAMLLRSRLDPQ